jgi:hypothetical protein
MLCRDSIVWCAPQPPGRSKYDSYMKRPHDTRTVVGGGKAADLEASLESKWDLIVMWNSRESVDPFHFSLVGTAVVLSGTQESSMIE